MQQLIITGAKESVVGERMWMWMWIDLRKDNLSVRNLGTSVASQKGGVKVEGLKTVRITVRQQAKGRSLCYEVRFCRLQSSESSSCEEK